jgi:hypothetical protein
MIMTHRLHTLKSSKEELNKKEKGVSSPSHSYQNTHPPVLYTPVYIFLLPLRHTGTTKASQQISYATLLAWYIFLGLLLGVLLLPIGVALSCSVERMVGILRCISMVQRIRGV